MKLTTLLMTALLLSFTTGNVLARDHHDQRGKQNNDIQYRVEKARELRGHTTTKHYKSTRDHKQQPKDRWAKKRRHEKHRDYIVRRQLHQQTRLQTQQQAKLNRYAHNNLRNNRHHRDMGNRHNRVQQIVLPVIPIPRIVFHFPW